MKIPLLAVLLAISGCSTTDTWIERFNSASASKSESYKDGWRSGCKSGRYERCAAIADSSARYERSDVRMKGEQDYSLGWNDGYRMCIAGC